MTLFFDLTKLREEAGSNPRDIVATLETFYYKKLPNRRKGIKAIKRNLAGLSFILNPEPLFKAKKHIELAYIVQYISLAGKRDYTLYKYNGIKTLDLSYHPDILMQNIRLNPLLKITDKEIFFLYEEQIGKKTNGIKF